MSRPLVSVVMATFERGGLLARSLSTYETSKGIDPKEDLELVVIDDHSTDETAYIVAEWSRRTGICSVVMTPHPKSAAWRDCGAILNHGIRASSGKHILLTHPEVMVGKRSIAGCIEKLEEWEGYNPHNIDGSKPLGLYACCRIYYLSPREQGLLDSVDWYSKGALAVRDIEGFYELDINGHPDFCHKATDIVAQPGSRIPSWDSLVFGGCSRQTWKRLGGLQPTQKWGSVDVLFMERRRRLGIPNYTCPEDEAICVHQNHDTPGHVLSPRIEADWRKELEGVNMTPHALVYPAVDELGWGG